MKQHVIISELCNKEVIDLSEDKTLESFVIEGGFYHSLTEFLDEIKKTKLVFIENNKLKLLTDHCQCVILPNGKVVAADNKSGRLTRWIEKNFYKNNL